MHHGRTRTAPCRASCRASCNAHPNLVRRLLLSTQCNPQHVTYSITQHIAYSMQHATRTIPTAALQSQTPPLRKRLTWRMQHALGRIQRAATCNMHHARCNVQREPCNSYKRIVHHPRACDAAALELDRPAIHAHHATKLHTAAPIRLRPDRPPLPRVPMQWYWRSSQNRTPRCL